MWRMDWDRLAQTIIERRVELGHRTREAFVAASGLSGRLVGDLEKNRRQNYDRVTIARLEQALLWPTGSVNRILRGEPFPDPARGGLGRGLGALIPPGPPTDRVRAEALAARLVRLVGPDSPLPEDRERLAGLLDYLLGTFERLAEGGRS